MPRFESAAAAALALAVYLLLAPAVSGMGDGSELTLVLATNGVAHPTGYPLYTLFGHWFCRALHALGATWPYAANAWSAAGGAVAIFFLHALASRLVDPGVATGAGAGARFAAALLPAVLLAFNPILLGEATYAEVNSWNLAFCCGTAYCFVTLLRGLAQRGLPERGLAESSPDHPSGIHRVAALWGLLCGVGLAHHLASVLVSAPLSLGLVAALTQRRALRASLVIAAMAGALAPLASYGILYWRAYHPAEVQWPLLAPSLSSVLQHITGEQYGHYVGYFAPSEPHRELLARAGYPFLYPGLALLLLGAIRARSVELRIGWWSLLAAALLTIVFAFRYGVPDPAPYFLPAMALGLAAIAPFAANLFTAAAIRGSYRLGGAVAVGLVVLSLLVTWVKDGVAVRHEVIVFDRVIRSMWSAVPEDTAIVVWPDDRYMRLREYQILGNEKPALHVTNPDDLVGDLPRERFRARFGADPLEGLTIPRLRPGSPGEQEAATRFLARVVVNVNARTRVPVILFDPSTPVVKLLTKPIASAPAH